MNRGGKTGPVRGERYWNGRNRCSRAGSKVSGRRSGKPEPAKLHRFVNFDFAGAPGYFSVDARAALSEGQAHARITDLQIV
jgi:hypothetical protein